MRKSRRALAVASAFPLALCVGVSAFAQTADSTGRSNAPVKELGVVTISGGQPTSLPTQIPTTIEGVTREQIQENCGWPVKFAAEVRETPAPDETELSVLRDLHARTKAAHAA